MNTAIIAAGGNGTRFGADKPKQFLEIHGKPLLIHTLAPFEQCAAIDEIILVLPAAEIENFQIQIGKYNLSNRVKLIAGGQTRAASVLNGLNAIDAKKCAVVAVHDGARPLVSVEEIAATIEKVKETGAACLVAPVTDTIKEIKNGKITRTVDRETLRRALTPQAFRYEILKRAFAESSDLSGATDECFLVEKLGYEISTVEGSAKNIKVTNREDAAIVENFLKQSQI